MIKCYFDGACEPTNPGGNLGIGAIVFHNNEAVLRHSDFIAAAQFNSNNVAEYLGLEQILIFLKDYSCEENKIFIYGDSKLVINQMTGKWRIKFGYYKEAALRCKKLIGTINKELVFTWIPREINQFADDLSKGKLILNGVEFKIQPHGTI
jgi:ribonuclease HI